MKTSGYEERLVVFIDILGFKDILRGTVVDDKDCIEEIQLLIDAYDLIRKHLIEGSGKIERKNITIFSDCIVISIKPKENSIINEFKIINELIILLLEKNILCRGGVSFGKILHTNEYVFGPALVEAHILEEKVANYPRVILHESVINELHNQSDVHKEDLINKYLTVDFDGYYYFDYINKGVRMSKYDYGDPYLEILSILHKLVSYNFKKFNRPDQVAIRSKYNWLNNKLRFQLIDLWSNKSAPSDSYLDKFALGKSVEDNRVPKLKFKEKRDIFGNIEGFLFEKLYSDYDEYRRFKSFLEKLDEEDSVLEDKVIIKNKGKSKYHK